MATASSILFVRESMAKSKQQFNLIQLFHETSFIGPLPSGLGRVLNSGQLPVRWFAKWIANFRFYSLENDLTTAFRAVQIHEGLVNVLYISRYLVYLRSYPLIHTKGCEDGTKTATSAATADGAAGWAGAIPRWRPIANDRFPCCLPVACRPCKLSVVNF